MVVSIARRRFIAFSLVWALLWLAPFQLYANTPAEVKLQQDQSVPELGKKAQAFLDDGRGLAAIVEAFHAGAFRDNFDAIARQGAPYQPVWAAVSLQNAAPDDGREADEWIPEIRTYGLVGADVFLVRAGGLTEKLLQHSMRQPFSAANYSGMRLRAGPIRLQPGESALLFVKFVFGPIARPNIALMTPLDHDASVFSDSIAVAAWYAFMLACLLFHIGFSLSMRSRVGAAYGVTFLLALLFVAYLDGFLFRFVYPADPARHLQVGIGLLLVTAGAGFVAAAAALYDFCDQPKGVKLRLAAGAASIGAALLAPYGPAEIMANIAYAAFIAMLAAQAFAAPQWGRVFKPTRAHFQVLTAALAVVAAAWLGAMLLGRAPGWAPMGWWIKTLFAAVMIWTIGTLSWGLVFMRREHEATLKRALLAVSERERIAHELLSAEQNYNAARALADRRRAQLASASHDFRQPLASLRLTLQEFGGRLHAAQRQRLEDAFDYMEGVSADLLDETRKDPHGLPEETEPYPLSLVLETIAKMFGREAAHKGLSLHVAPSCEYASTPPLALTRIVSNLVSNAIKYTDSGGVDVSVRSTAEGRLRVSVSDTGPGLCAQALARLSKAYVKGESSTGVGLGLAICFELAAEHGLALSLDPKTDAGTRFILDIPAAPSSAV